MCLRNTGANNMIDITQEDYNLLKQSEIELRMRIYVLNKDGTVLKNIENEKSFMV